MTVSIREERAGSPLLLDLQLRILPNDTPCNIHIGWWWVAWLGDDPIGFAGLHPSKRWVDAAYLCRCGVDRRMRGQGIQRRLIHVREKRARKVGFEWLITETWNNPASANSLINCGFKIFNPRSPWATSESVYWRKRIGQQTDADTTNSR